MKKVKKITGATVVTCGLFLFLLLCVGSDNAFAATKNICSSTVSIPISARVRKVIVKGPAGEPLADVKIVRTGGSPTRLTAYTNASGVASISSNPGAIQYSYSAERFAYEFVRLNTSNSELRIVLEPCEPTNRHSADTTEPFGRFSQAELDRVTELYNAGRYYCSRIEQTIDGYLPGRFPDLSSCQPHSSDYLSTADARPDWSISIEEFLRFVQLKNSKNGYYHVDLTTDDGFAPGIR